MAKFKGGVIDFGSLILPRVRGIPHARAIFNFGFLMALLRPACAGLRRAPGAGGKLGPWREAEETEGVATGEF